MYLPFRTDYLAKQIAVKSAVNPSLWACAVVSLPLFYWARTTQGILSIAFFVIATIPVVTFIFSYFYLLFKDPEYLRSEEYQLKMNSMRLLGDKDNPLQANAKDIVSMINNPTLPPPKKQE